MGMKKLSLTKDRKGRITLSSQERERLLQDYSSSGLSQMAYAKKCGIKYTTFAGWIQRQRRGSKIQAKDSSAIEVSGESHAGPVGFAQVDLSMPTGQSYRCWGWELELKSGALLRISSATALASVLEVIESVQVLRK